jgi:hypothetical protein
VKLVTVTLTWSGGLALRLQFPVAFVIVVARTSEELKVLQELVEAELEGRAQSFPLLASKAPNHPAATE